MNAQPEITFPLNWEFRIVSIAAEIDRVQPVCLGILHRTDPAATISRGLESKGGKYITLRANCHIEDRNILRTVSDALAAVDGVKMLI